MNLTIGFGLATAALAVGVATAAPAGAAQGADDRSGPPANAHSWIKVGGDEARSKGVDRACTEIFGQGWSGYRPCDHLVPLIMNQKLNNPNAAGYWAEWYFNTGRTRAGTW